MKNTFNRGTMDDNALVKEIENLRKGSYHAFNTLYHAYFDRLYGYVFKLTRSHESTREVVQVTFIKLWQNRGAIDLSLSFKSYLFSIAKHHLLDELKKQMAAPVFEDYLAYCDQEQLAVHAEQEFDIELFRLLLQKAKGKLSPRQSEVFTLTKEEGMAPGEVAQQLNLPEQVVYNYLSQSLAILRQEMKQMAPLFLLFFQ